MNLSQMDKTLLNFLSELKKYGVINNIPNVTERGGRFLNMLVKISGSKQILEIGCANGYSTIWLAEAARRNCGRINSIDFSEPTLESAKENLVNAGLSEVVDFHFGNALELVPTISNPKKFDFVFVDGEKRSYWDFWNVIQNRLSDNAIIIFDDALSFPHKTDIFMKKIKNVLGFEQVVMPIDHDDGILLIHKI